MTVLFASAARAGADEHYARGLWPLHLPGSESAGGQYSLFLAPPVHDLPVLVVVVTGNWFFNLIEQVFHLERVAERFGTWQWMKYLLLLGIVFLFILLLYRVHRPADPSPPPSDGGRAGASVALAAASVIFSWFMARSTNYSLVYGSLASVIILLVWLYLCGNILILGSVVNAVLYHHRWRRSGRKDRKRDGNNRIAPDLMAWVRGIV